MHTKYIHMYLCVCKYYTNIHRTIHVHTYVHTYVQLPLYCTKRLTGIRGYNQIDSSDSDDGRLSCKLLPRNFERDLLCNVVMIDGDTQGRLKIQKEKDG